MALDPTAQAAADRCAAITPSLFDGYNHRDVFPQTGKDMGTLANAIAAQADLAVGAADAMQGTSTTSTAIATGSKVFTTQAGRSFAVGRYVQIVSAANRTGRQMSGMVTAYSGTSLTVDVASVIGSGTAADWLIFLSGPAGKGEPGDDGSTVLGGAGAPSSEDGANGDFYIDTAANAIYGPKTVGAWGAGRNIKGADGKTVHSGAGDPGGGLGVDGDFYIDTAVLEIFGPKTSGVWGVGTSLRGAAATIGVNSVTTVAAGEPATVVNVGTPEAAEFDFGIPKGDSGDAATIEIGDVTAISAGSPPTVTNVGTPNAAVLNFGLPQGEVGPAGPVIAGSWNFSTDTADEDPGNGNVRLNHATPANATFIYFDNFDARGATVTAWLDALDDSTTPSNKGVLRLTPINTPTTFAEYRVTGAVVDGTGYRKVPVAYITGIGLPANTARVAFSFSRTGDAGGAGTGSGDVTTSGPVTAGNLARFADNTGDVLEDGGAFSPFSASLLGGVNEAAWKTALNLESGIDVQGYSALLAAIAGLSMVADRIIYGTGAGTVGLATLTSHARTILAAVDAAASRLAIGAEATANKNQANGYAGLDSSGKIGESCLPALAITDTFEVVNQTAMLALTAERGDIAVRSDLNKTFILKQSPASTLANWVELRTPTDVVLSVAGLTGAITGSALKTALAIAAADIGDASVNGRALITAADYVAMKGLLGIALAVASEVRTGSDTTKFLGVDETWKALAPVALTDASTVAVNLSSGINFSVTLGGNRTLGNPTSSGGWKVGQQGEITVSRAGTQTLSFASNWIAFGNATLPTTSGKGFKVVYEVISSTVIHFNVVGQV
ncbi:MAG: hypothetical protein KF735_02205 [Chelatococcus sp.]|uniref:hypothetical protein n=1 Tax=Chelatococcus sp. TaxID=1953771 RepID=UPI0025C134C9|nr:hypothetical protein [Chelatococcus sp.]MBX3536425.1 hypothetical protein [Chelatococcus sp.]